MEIKYWLIIHEVTSHPAPPPPFLQDVAEFTLEPVTGEIRTRERIDREVLGSEGRFDMVVISSSPTYPIEVSGWRHQHKLYEYTIKIYMCTFFLEC